MPHFADADIHHGRLLVSIAETTLCRSFTSIRWVLDAASDLTKLAQYVTHTLLLVHCTEPATSLTLVIEIRSACAQGMLTLFTQHIHHAALLVSNTEATVRLTQEVEYWLHGACFGFALFADHVHHAQLLMLVTEPPG